MKSRQWSNFFKSLLEFVALSTTIHSCRIAYLHLDNSAVHLHCAIFMFFFCFCMSYAKIELFIQWNKNILNDCRPVFTVHVLLNVKEEYDKSFNWCIPFHKTQHQIVYITCANNLCCVPTIADTQWVDVPGTGWVRERGDSRGWEHTRQVCTAYVVTWRL